MLLVSSGIDERRDAFEEPQAAGFVLDRSYRRQVKRITQLGQETRGLGQEVRTRASDTGRTYGRLERFGENTVGNLGTGESLAPNEDKRWTKRPDMDEELTKKARLTGSVLALDERDSAGIFANGPPDGEKISELLLASEELQLGFPGLTCR